MDLLIPVNFISVNRQEYNLVAVHSIQKVKDKHFILKICGLQTLNIQDEKHLVTQCGETCPERIQSDAAHNRVVYCVLHDAKNFVFDDLKFANVLIAQQYFKICSFAFLLGVGKDCFLKDDKLFMYNVNDQKIDNIVPDFLRFLSPREVMVVIEDVNKTLDLFEEYNFISNDVNLIMKNEYQTQVMNDMF